MLRGTELGTFMKTKGQKKERQRESSCVLWGHDSKFDFVLTNYCSGTTCYQYPQDI